MRNFHKSRYKSKFTELPDGKVMFNSKVYKNLHTAESMEWVQRNKEKHDKYHHEYNKTNLEHDRNYRRERAKNDPEFTKNRNSTARKWYALNPDKIKQSYLRNRERILRNRIEYQQKNKEKIRERTKRYRKNNPGKINALVAKRNSKMKVPIKQIELIRSIYMLASSNEKKTCYYCQKDFTIPVHVDHVIPLAKGGPHSIENLCLACPKCNITKNAKLPDQITFHSQKILSL